MTADENLFADLSIWKQSTARHKPIQEEPHVGAPTKSVASASIWGSATFGEAADESTDSVLTAPTGVVPRAAVEPNPWAAPTDLSSSEVAPVAPPRAEPTSFIERYSHMFAEESTDNPAPSAPIPQPTAAATTNSKPLTLGIARNAATEPNSSASNDEESIEQYMAKLLERVRGDGPAAQPLRKLRQFSLVHRKQHRLGSRCRWSTRPRLPTSQLSVSRCRKPKQLKNSRPGMPTTARRHRLLQPTDMGALRALANQTARRAISRHQLTKHRRDAVTKVIVSTLAGMTSLWLMLARIELARHSVHRGLRIADRGRLLGAAKPFAHCSSRCEPRPTTATKMIRTSPIAVTIRRCRSTSKTGSRSPALDSRPSTLDLLEPSLRAYVVEVAQVVVDADVIEHAAQAADGDAHSVGAAEAAELAAALQVRLQIENDARDAALLELLFELRNDFGEVAQDALVAAVAQVGPARSA